MTELTLQVKYVQLKVLPISLLTAEWPKTVTCCKEAIILLSSFACFFTLNFWGLGFSHQSQTAFS